jgi:hypothetical protein
MIRTIAVTAVWMSLTHVGLAQSDNGPDAAAEPGGHEAVHQGLEFSNSPEGDVLPSASPHEALQELEWLIGTWQDQSEDARVVTTVRWSPNRAFLIRSFTAQFADEEQQGTQIIGWDPSSRQIRTWIFHSDGSFGQGTISRHDDAWMLKMSQTLSDGRTAAGTQVITRVDDDTITVQVIGESVDGELLPTSDPVTVVRTADASGNAVGGTANEEGAKP